MDVQHEIKLLVEEIQRLGSKNADGKTSVKFGVLFSDDRCANIFEALVGTLRAAKKKKVVTFQGELLLQGVHDDVDVILLQDAGGGARDAGGGATCSTGGEPADAGGGATRSATCGPASSAACSLPPPASLGPPPALHVTPLPASPSANIAPLSYHPAPTPAAPYPVHPPQHYQPDTA